MHLSSFAVCPSFLFRFWTCKHIWFSSFITFRAPLEKIWQILETLRMFEKDCLVRWMFGVETILSAVSRHRVERHQSVIANKQWQQTVDWHTRHCQQTIADMLMLVTNEGTYSIEVIHQYSCNFTNTAYKYNVFKQLKWLNHYHLGMGMV